MNNQNKDTMIIASKLKRTLLELGHTEVEAMNILQEHGVISDNCVMVDDVANEDVPKAIECLEGRLL